MGSGGRVLDDFWTAKFSVLSSVQYSTSNIQLDGQRIRYEWYLGGCLIMLALLYLSVISKLGPLL